ncbi:amidohydrolase family protein [bacterium]|nr:amidohydrolase family protein [bacterium]
MTNHKTLSGLCLTLLAINAAVTAFANDEIPGAKQAKPIAITGATLHPVSSAPIENATIVFDKGKITAVGVGVAIPEGAITNDFKGKHVYPSLFETHSQIGLIEVEAVRASVDENEAGSINPNVKGHIAFNPDSEIIPVTRANGVLLTVTAPVGGLIPGQASVMQLDGWTWEDMSVKQSAAMMVTWPGVDDVLNNDDKTKRSDRDEDVKKLQKLFDDAAAYKKARAANADSQKHDVRLEALLPVLDGTMPMMIKADSLDTIQSAVAFAAENHVKAIIMGGYDAPLCADLLKQHDVPVVILAVHRSPRRRGDDYDAAYTLPERLRKAGVKFCISGAGRWATANVRNLPYQAGTAVGYGLPHDEALKSITLYPAQIMGVADRVGSLEVGKDATLFVSGGDPLETTSNPIAAWVQGRRVELNSRHKRLYRKYKIRQQQKAAEGE